MKRILNFCLLLTSLVGYLEWSGNQHGFLFQLEYELITKASHDPGSILHPFVLVPLSGQLTILYTLVQKTPGRLLTLVGLACLSMLMLMILLVGILTLNSKIVASVMPFIITGIFVLRYNRKRTSMI
ncbi:MAG: hypothetical protein IPP96_13925 [Chitinophagaceae bacterium]|nr:hypothetical protein [Chitinophagaceae bacterium]